MSAYTHRYDFMHHNLHNYRNNTEFLICASNDFVKKKKTPLPLPMGWPEDYMNTEMSIHHMSTVVKDKGDYYYSVWPW